jgi:predicted HAD superfamily Cof-like phosphohydrolase
MTIRRSSNDEYRNDGEPDVLGEDSKEYTSTAGNPWVTDVFEFHKMSGATIGWLPEIRGESLRGALLDEEVQEFHEAISSNDLVGAIDALCDIIYVAIGAGITFGVDLSPFWDEVHRSNMSKTGASVLADGKAAGKVIKGPNYSPPNLHRILRERYYA